MLPKDYISSRLFVLSVPGCLGVQAWWMRKMSSNKSINSENG